MRIRAIPVLLVALAAIGCGGKDKEDGGGGQGELAAKACDASAKQQLGEKTYSLDLAMLGTSMAAQPDGSQLLKGPIGVEPGLTSESKQTLECSVRVGPAQPTPDVLRVQFLWWADDGAARRRLAFRGSGDSREALLRMRFWWEGPEARSWRTSDRSVASGLAALPQHPRYSS